VATSNTSAHRHRNRNVPLAVPVVAAAAEGVEAYLFRKTSEQIQILLALIAAGDESLFSSTAVIGLIEVEIKSQIPFMRASNK
jgi:hypothetical protein